MKSILVLEGRETIGGGQVVTKRICNVLSKKYNVEVLIPGNSCSQISQYLKNFKQHFYILKEYGRGRKKIIDYFRFLYNLFTICSSLFKLLKRNHYDLIYIQHQNILPEIIFVNKFWGIPCISHLHVYYSDGIARKLVNWCLADKSINCVIGVSNYTLSQLNDNIKRKSKVLYNSVPLKTLANPHTWNNRVAIVGDVIPNKGHKILLDALKMQSEKYTLFMIGTIVSEKFFDILEVDCGNVKIIATGMINNVSEYLNTNNIDLVVVPSIAPFETFSLAMVEAWSMGIPTIATNDFGMKEIVSTFAHEFMDYILFEKGNSTDLFKKISLFATNENLRYKVGSTLRTIVKERLNENIFESNLTNYVSEICKHSSSSSQTDENMSENTYD